MADKDYKDGANAAISFYKSRCNGFSFNIRAEDAIKMYLPPVVEYLTQVSSPLPKPRKDWIKGFKEEQVNILAEINKPKE